MSTGSRQKRHPKPAADQSGARAGRRSRILERLLEKLDQMRAVLADRVFDVIGEVLSLNDVNLPDMLREAAHDPKRLEEYLDRKHAPRKRSRT